MSQGSKYQNQRKLKPPPVAPIKGVRQRLGFSLEYVAAELTAMDGRKHNKGTISAIENGVRGVSEEFLAHLEVIYGMPLTTYYIPRPQRVKRDTE